MGFARALPILRAARFIQSAGPAAAACGRDLSARRGQGVKVGHGLFDFRKKLQTTLAIAAVARLGVVVVEIPC